MVISRLGRIDTVDIGKQAELESQLLDLTADQVRVSPYAVTLSMLAVGYLIYGHIPDRPLLWGGWVGAVVLTQLYRMYRLPKLLHEDWRPPGSRAREAAAINAVGIFIQSLSLLAFPLFTPFEAAVQTGIFIAMGVGSIVTAVGWAPFALTHLWGSLAPTLCFWVWSGLYGPAGSLGLLVAAIGVPYGFTMWNVSKRLYQINEESLANRLALAQALEESERASGAKTRFLAAASHDLRQPLHTLSLLGAALSTRELDQRAGEIASGIQEAVNALAMELDSLLDISKLDAGIVSVNVTDFDIDSLLQRLGAEIASEAGERGIEVEIDIGENEFVSTDAVLLERILRNLLNNAVKHNRDCSVRLTTSLTGNRCELVVADTGSGIAAQEQPHIFEEFYQVGNPERDRSQGLGLGLSIVKRLAELLALQMQFSSSPGEGTQFSFTLPRASEPFAGVQLEPKFLQQPPGTILVVDDEEAIREAMQVLFEAHGWQVLLADSAQAALSQVEIAEPDITLIDFRLRGRENGIDTLRQLRELCPKMPAVFVTGETTAQTLREVDRVGVPLLNKPVSAARLFSTIALLRGADQGQP